MMRQAWPGVMRFAASCARPHGAVALPSPIPPTATAALSGAARASGQAPPRPPQNGNGRSLAVLAFGGVCVGAAVHEMVYGGQPHVATSAPAPPSPHVEGASAHDVQSVASSPDVAHADTQSEHSLAGAMSEEAPTAAPGAGSGRVAQQADDKVPPPWTKDEETALIWHRRAVTKNRLTAYIDDMQRHMMKLAEQAQIMGSRGQAWFAERMKELEPQVDLQAQMILFGVDTPNARRRYLEKYGCTKWSDAALEVIKQYSPLVEIGGGHGHWQAALTRIGADVVSFDDNSALPMAGMPPVGKVSQGDESQVRKHRRRTLLLVYPGPDDMAVNALKAYSGRHLLYVGESKGGINANDAFFDLLEKEWEMVSTENVEPFPEGYERLYVLKRKKASRGWLW